MCDLMVCSDYYGNVRIPGWARTEEGFRRWQTMPDFPRHVPMRIENGDLHIDISDPTRPKYTRYHGRRQPRTRGNP